MSALVIESREGRRIVGRLGSGLDLIDELLVVCGKHGVRSATVQASGVLETLAVAHYDPSARAMGKPRYFRTPLQIISAQGTLSELAGKAHLEVNVVASRKGDNGIEVIGGVATVARVLTCEFVIDAMDDVMLRRRPDRATGLSLLHEVLGKGDDGETTVRAQADGGQITEASYPGVDAAAEAHTEPEYRAMKVGDVIEHGTFGPCVVERVDANEEFATVRLRNNRMVRLSLDVLNLRYRGEQDGHQTFATE